MSDTLITPKGVDVRPKLMYAAPCPVPRDFWFIVGREVNACLSIMR